MASSSEQEYSTTQREESDPEIHQQVQGHFPENANYGGRPQQPKGLYFYQEGGKMYASLPIEMLQRIQQSPLFKKMKKDCAAKGIELPKDIMAKDPRVHVLTPQQYLKNVEAGTMPQM